MEQKTKVSLVILSLLLLILAGVVYVGTKKKTIPQTQPQTQTTLPQETVKPTAEKQKASEAPVAENKTYQETQPDMKTVTVTGKVVSATKDSLEIINGEVKNTLPLTPKVLVISIKGGKSETKTVADLKKNDNVAIVINAANSEVVGIQIGD
jgi:RNase P/RNase MRP subunit p29